MICLYFKLDWAVVWLIEWKMATCTGTSINFASIRLTTNTIQKITVDNITSLFLEVIL